MSEFTLRGVKIRIDFSFLIFSALIFLLEDVGTVFAFFTVCLLHELGHAAALHLTGGRVSALLFFGTGIKMLPARRGIAPVKSELAVLLAGPAVNLLMFALLNAADPGNTFALLNLAAALFNLLPYRSLDGGAALKLLFEYYDCETVGKILLAAARLALVAAAAYAAIFAEKSAFVLLCIAIFYFFSELKCQ